MSAFIHNSSSSVEYHALHFIRKMNGSAQSILVEDADSKLWVLKPNHPLQGANVLANEFIGSEMLRALGIRVPDSRCFHLDAESVRELGVSLNSPQGEVSLAEGMHFLSRYVPDATGVDAYEVIPPTLQSIVTDQVQILGMLIFDIWAIHADRRQALFSIEGNKLSPTFIDNGHLFGGPDWKSTEPHLYPQLLEKLALQWHHSTQVSEEWVLRMEGIIPAALERAIARTPPSWLTGDIMKLVKTLLDRLQELRILIKLAFAQVECRLGKAGDFEQPHRGFDFRILSHRGAAGWA